MVDIAEVLVSQAVIGHKLQKQWLPVKTLLAAVHASSNVIKPLYERAFTARLLYVVETTTSHNDAGGAGEHTWYITRSMNTGEKQEKVQFFMLAWMAHCHQETYLQMAASGCWTGTTRSCTTGRPLPPNAAANHRHGKHARRRPALQPRQRAVHVSTSTRPRRLALLLAVPAKSVRRAQLPHGRGANTNRTARTATPVSTTATTITTLPPATDTTTATSTTAATPLAMTPSLVATPATPHDASPATATTTTATPTNVTATALPPATTRTTATSTTAATPTTATAPPEVPPADTGATAKEMMRLAWHGKFPNLSFPEKTFLGHNTDASASTCRHETQDVTLKNGHTVFAVRSNYSVVPSSTVSLYINQSDTATQAHETIFRQRPAQELAAHEAGDSNICGVASCCIHRSYAVAHCPCPQHPITGNGLRPW